LAPDGTTKVVTTNPGRTYARMYYIIVTNNNAAPVNYSLSIN
jgi:hypothetical protein